MRFCPDSQWSALIRKVVCLGWQLFWPRRALSSPCQYDCMETRACVLFKLSISLSFGWRAGSRCDPVERWYARFLCVLFSSIGILQDLTPSCNAARVTTRMECEWSSRWNGTRWTKSGRNTSKNQKLSRSKIWNSGSSQIQDLKSWDSGLDELAHLETRNWGDYRF